MSNLSWKRHFIKSIPYLIVAFLSTHIGEAWRLAASYENELRVMGFLEMLPVSFSKMIPSFHPFDLLTGVCIAAVLRLFVYLKSLDEKHYRKGVEYGSARWGTKKDIEPFVDPEFQRNVILTGSEFLTMESRPKNPAYARNKNCLIIGGSGSGKTRGWLKPNLLQMHSSYMVCDPKGEILLSCGNALLKNGYQVRILNTIDPSKSHHYNPFVYIHSEKDILKLVTALIAYIHYEVPSDEQNFASLLNLLNLMEVREDDEDYENPVDVIFRNLKKKKPDHFAVRQYTKFKMAAGKTLKSILISCAVRLAPFDIEELRKLTAYDELDLDTLGDRKTALFLIMSDTDPTFNFLISIAYTQMFNLLCEKADHEYGGRLPVHVRCLIDEMANIGQIPHLEKLIATIRSREISACLVLQTQSQLKALYKDNMETITGNCDSKIFLGGTETTTLKDLSAQLGKETIDTYNTGENRGKETSHSMNYQKLGKELMTQDELSVMDGGKCILQLRGVRPFYSDKYDLTQHPMYKYTADYDQKNAFDIGKLFERHMPLKADDLYEVIQA